MPKQKRDNKKKTNTNINDWRDGLKGLKTKFITGLITLFSSIYLLLAFVSFLFTGFADKSKFDLSWWDLITSSDITVENWTGKLGAYIADTLINQGIGLSAFAILYLLFLIGFRLLGIKLISLKKAFIHSFIISIWFSIAMGFIFIADINNQFLLLGGTHGYYMSKWIKAAIGNAGVIILLLASLITYLSFTFDTFYHKVNQLIKKQPQGLETEVENNEAAVLTDHLEEEDELETEEYSITEENNNQELESLFPTEEPIEFDISQAIHKEPETTTKTTHNIQLETISSAQHEDTFEKIIPSDNGLDLKIEQFEEEETYEENNQDALGDYDPTLDLSSYQLPPIDLLDPHGSSNKQVSMEELNQNKENIVRTLEHYKITIENIKATIGPTVTLYEIVPAPGTRISKIKGLEDDIALSLAALGIRIIAPIPGKGTIGIEVPNSSPDVVSMKSIISSKKFQQTTYDLPVCLGKTISNETFVFDLAKAPHLLVAGATGQGKSVGINAIITSLLYKKHPSQLKFVMVDPKKVELSIYSKIERHFLSKMPDEEEAIITDVQKVVNTLNSCCIEMDDRYDLLKKAHARNLKEYNHKFVKRKLNPEKGHRFLPYIVVIVDEFADLIMTAGKEVEIPIARIAQLARAVGIHMIIATQRPSTNIITGSIKANFPTRIAFKVASMIDSRTILDAPGANQLIGRGDMLISQGSDIIRVQCAFVDTPEVEAITDFIGEQRGYASAFMLPEYQGSENSGNEPGDVDMSKRDAIFDEAAKIVVLNQSGSTSLIQRRFSIGYNRAGRIIDQLEAANIVGPFEGSKARKVLVSDEQELERILDQLRS